MYRTFVAALYLLSAPLCAQLTVTSTATDFTVGNPNTLSTPGPLVHPTIIDVGAPGPISAYSRLAYEVEQPDADTTILWISGSSVSTDYFGLGTGPAAFQTLDATILLTSQARMLVDIEVELVHINEGITPATTTTNLDIGGLGIVAVNDPITTFRAEVDSSGFAIEYDLSNLLPWPLVHTSAHSSHVILRMQLTPATVATSYGASCGGPTLDFAASLSGAPIVTAADPLAQTGVIAIGTQWNNTPLTDFGLSSNCLLLTDVDVSIPISMPFGQKTFEFVAPTNLARMQLLIEDATGVRASNALLFQR